MGVAARGNVSILTRHVQGGSEEAYGPSFILSLPVLTGCVIVCGGLSLNFAHGGTHVGFTRGIGARAEVSLGTSVGVGTTQGKGNMSVECGGLWGWGLFGGVNLPPAGSGEFLTGGFLGTGVGLGGGCSMMWTDYVKI